MITYSSGLCINSQHYGSMAMVMLPDLVIYASGDGWGPDINSLPPPEIWMKFSICDFQMDFIDLWLRLLLWNCPNMNVTGLHWWSINIVQVMAWCHQATSHYLTNVDPYLCHHMVSLGQNEITANNTLRWKQHGFYFTGFIFKCIFPVKILAKIFS